MAWIGLIFPCSPRSGKTFLHEIVGDPDDDSPEFVCPEEDPVTVNLTDDEQRQLELTV